MAELVIRGGTVVDGTGAPGRRADVAIDAGCVVAIDTRLDGFADATRVLDASGMVVAPGFVDVHTHYDAQVLWDPQLTPSCWQGVTTVIAGNCGFGLAPCHPEHRDLVVRTLEHVEAMSPDALRAGITWDFETFPEYLDAVERRAPLLNFGAYVGHTAVRLWVMGEDAYERAATDDEVAAMVRVVAGAMEAGAVGFSSSASVSHNGDGGRPVPSRLAKLDEYEALVAAVGVTGHGVIEIIPGDLAALMGSADAEAIALQPGGKIRLADVLTWPARFGRPVTWTPLLAMPGDAHLKALEVARGAAGGGLTGSGSWPQVTSRPFVMQLDLREPFVLDLVPAFSELHGLGDAVRRARYADPSWRDTTQDALESGPFAPPWALISVDETTHAPELVGRSVASVAAERGVRELDVMCEVALADDLDTRFRLAIANADERSVTALLREDGVMIGLGDAGAHASQLCDACYATDLLEYAREHAVMSLEAAVHKLTGEPAAVFGLDRGVLAPGAPADVVVFDPATVAPGPTRRVYDLPAGADRLIADRPEGLAHVVVNGVPIRVDGAADAAALEARPGRVLRSGTAEEA